MKSWINYDPKHPKTLTYEFLRDLKARLHYHQANDSNLQFLDLHDEESIQYAAHDKIKHPFQIPDDRIDY